MTLKNASKREVGNDFNDPPDGLFFPRSRRFNPVQDVSCHCRNVCKANGWPDGHSLVDDRFPPVSTYRAVPAQGCRSPNRPMLQRSLVISDIHKLRSISSRASIFRPNHQWISRRMYVGVLFERWIFIPALFRHLYKDDLLCLSKPRWRARTGLRRGPVRRQQRRHCAHLIS